MAGIDAWQTETQAWDKSDPVGRVQAALDELYQAGIVATRFVFGLHYISKEKTELLLSIPAEEWDRSCLSEAFRVLKDHQEMLEKQEIFYDVLLRDVKADPRAVKNGTRFAQAKQAFDEISEASHRRIRVRSENGKTLCVHVHPKYFKELCTFIISELPANERYQTRDDAKIFPWIITGISVFAFRNYVEGNPVYKAALDLQGEWPLMPGEKRSESGVGEGKETGKNGAEKTKYADMEPVSLPSGVIVPSGVDPLDVILMEKGKLQTRIWMNAPRHKNLLGRLREINGHKTGCLETPEGKKRFYSMFPNKQLATVRACLQEMGKNALVEVDEMSQGVPSAKNPGGEQAAAREAWNMRVETYLGRNREERERLILSFPYDKDIIEALTLMPEAKRAAKDLGGGKKEWFWSIPEFDSLEALGKFRDFLRMHHAGSLPDEATAWLLKNEERLDSTSAILGIHAIDDLVKESAMQTTRKTRVPEVIFLYGLPYSGKTTWYRQHLRQSHQRLAPEAFSGERPGGFNREYAMGRLVEELREGLKLDGDIVIDASMLSRNDRKALLEVVRSTSSRHLARCVEFDVSLQEIERRINLDKRDRKPAIGMIRNMDKKAERPKAWEGFDEVVSYRDFNTMNQPEQAGHVLPKIMPIAASVREYIPEDLALPQKSAEFFDEEYGSSGLPENELEQEQEQSALDAILGTEQFGTAIDASFDIEFIDTPKEYVAFSAPIRNTVTSYSTPEEDEAWPEMADEEPDEEDEMFQPVAPHRSMFI